MATTFDWYPYDGDYSYSGSSIDWSDAKNHFYIKNTYDNRMYFYLNSSGGWTHGGRKIKITSAKFYVYRNYGPNNYGGTMTIYRNGNSGTSCSGTVASTNSTSSSLTCSEAFRTDLANFINAGNTSVNIKLSGITNGGSDYIRICGYDNDSYDDDCRPHFSITWDYEISTGAMTSSNYFYSASPTINITSNVSTDYHEVSWYINNESSAYYTQTLSAGVNTASCSFFGSSPSGAALNSLNYFSGTEKITAKVVLTTYSSSGTSLGSKTYTFILMKPLGGSLGELSSDVYSFNKPVILTLYPLYSTYRHNIKWKIQEEIVSTQTVAPTSAESITLSYNYFETLDPSLYFKELTNTISGSIIVETLDDQSIFLDSATYDFILKDENKSYLFTELSVNPIIQTSSIISTDPITGAQDTVENILDSFKQYYLDKMHPIDSIYISTEPTHPATLFGGIWIAYSPGRTILTTVDALKVGDSGGSFTHTLTTAEMGKHTHELYYTAGVIYTGTKGSEYGGGSSGTVSATGSSGSGGAHNNTQPYEICYMWRRTA